MLPCRFVIDAKAGMNLAEFDEPNLHWVTSSWMGRKESKAVRHIISPHAYVSITRKRFSEDYNLLKYALLKVIMTTVVIKKKTLSILKGS